MKRNIHSVSYLAHFLAEWKIFRRKFVKKRETHVWWPIAFFSFRKSTPLWGKVEKYCRAEQVTDDSMVHSHCMLGTQGYKNTHRLCNTHCFSTATMVKRTCLNVTHIKRTLPVLVFLTTQQHHNDTTAVLTLAHPPTIPANSKPFKAISSCH